MSTGGRFKLEVIDYVTHLSPPSKCLVGGDFNAWHDMFEPGIQAAHQGAELARWATESGMDFIGTPGAPTQRAGHVLDLTFSNAPMAFGLSLGYWHWFFLAQPFPLPERLIGANPDNFYFRQGRDSFNPEALEDYLRCVHNPATIHAMCEDYRAGATIDFTLDEADRGTRRITCPVLTLWSRRGELEQWYDVLAIWRDWANDVQGKGLDCGHFLAEEAPEEAYAELSAFFAAG